MELQSSASYKDNWLARMNYSAESDICIVKSSWHIEKDCRYFKNISQHTDGSYQNHPCAGGHAQMEHQGNESIPYKTIFFQFFRLFEPGVQ